MRDGVGNPHPTGPLEHARPRLPGITALAVFSFVAAVVAGLAAVSLAFPRSPLAPMWRLNPRGHEVFARLHGWAVLFLGVVSGMCAITGAGLWRQRRWGYLIAVVGLSIQLIGDTFSVLSGTEPRAVVGIPIVAALLGYLSRPHVKSTFAQR